MTKPGTSANSTDRQQKRSTEPGVIILAEIAFATLLLYLANQPLDIGDLSAAQRLASHTTIPAKNTDALTDALADNLEIGQTDNPDGIQPDFNAAAGVAVAASEINTTGAPVSN